MDISITQSLASELGFAQVRYCHYAVTGWEHQLGQGGVLKGNFCPLSHASSWPSRVPLATIFSWERKIRQRMQTHQHEGPDFPLICKTH